VAHPIINEQWADFAHLQYRFPKSTEDVEARRAVVQNQQLRPASGSTFLEFIFGARLSH
jgi:hypothetical protein